MIDRRPASDQTISVQAQALAGSGELSQLESVIRSSTPGCLAPKYPVLLGQHHPAMKGKTKKELIEELEAMRARISELEAAEEKLRESEAMHRQILDACADLILCKGPKSRIVYANKAFRDFYGMTMDELRGIVDAPFNEPEYTEQYQIDDACVFSTGKTLNIPEEPVTRHDGKVFLVHTIKSAIFNAAGKVVQTVGVSRDISERRQSEQQIHELNARLANRVEELAQANRELELLTKRLELARDQALESSNVKSQFVANISHEVRTPISAVIGLIELLLDSGLNREQREYATMIHDSAQALLMIINDILDFSKLEAGKIELEIIDFELAALIEDTVELLAAAAWGKKLALMSFVDPGIPYWLRGDPVRLRQIMINLISNAIKFTAAGSVTIRAVPAGKEENRLRVRIEVTDTGIGLSQSTQARLFQPFVQADGSTTRQYGGTGLGLSICRRLVDLMNGQIAVHSASGCGSTFWFELSLDEAVNRPSEPSFALDPASERALRVLLVHDDDTARDITARYLREAGVYTECTNDLRTATSMIEQSTASSSRYDAVVVNVKAGISDSSPLIALLQPGKHPPAPRFILLSPYDAKGGAERAIKAGFAAYVSWPIRRWELLDCLLTVTTGTTIPRPTRLEPAEIEHQLTAGSKPFSTDERNRSVLVVEDNSILRELARRQLCKLGLSSHVVSNGRQAVEAAAQSDYDLILMDCQMPGMSGFEASLTIRQEEAPSGRHTPIIAMTASAMPGDRERCLASGMDDYLSKPVSQEQLRRVLERWLPAAGNRCGPLSGLSLPSSRRPPPVGEIELTSLEEIYGKAEAADILKLFLTEAGELIAALEEALGRRDGRELSFAAHQLRGLAAVVGAGRMEKLCWELEVAAEERAWERAASSWPSLRDSFQAVNKLVEHFLDQLPG